MGRAPCSPFVAGKLTFNRGGAYDLLVMGGSVVIPEARTGGRIVEIGDPEGVTALDTVNFDGKFLHPAAATVRLKAGKGTIPLGSSAEFTVRETARPTSKVVGRVP